MTEDKGESKEAKVATAQQGRSRSCAVLLYSSNRDDPKNEICSLHSGAPRHRRETHGCPQNYIRGRV